MENISIEVGTFNRSIQQKYAQYIEQFNLLYYKEHESLYLNDIYIKPQYLGRGYGTKIMKEIIQFADSKQLPIELVPAPGSIKPNAMRRLVGFYKRFGFVENNGNPQFDDISMYRLPK